MLNVKFEISNVKDTIELATDVKDLLALKEALNNLINEQISKIENNQETVIAIRYDSFYGKFVVEQGLKAEYLIKGGFMKTSEKLEEVECKRQGTKKYQSILENLKEKYNPEFIRE